MSTQQRLTDAVAEGAPFVAITFLWLVIIAIVYGLFVFTWPSIPEGEPFVHLGVYVVPVIGFFGHVLQQALKLGRT
jgi:hypothetical protein